MNRREFVARSIAGGGIAAAGGCLSSMGENYPARRIAGIDAEASFPDVDVGGDVLQPTISADEQGAVRLRFGWNGDEPWTFGFGNQAPVSDPFRRSTPDGLVLTGDSSPEMRRDEETWVLDGVPLRSLEYYSPELDPSDGVASTYYLWGDPEHVNYVEGGNYVIRNTICSRRTGEYDAENPCDSFVTAYAIRIRETE